ncbi:hypothetical protein [Psychrobacillus sp. MER TA 171]|uniref:hypothetical protein n=1 Tax=Psychrobacillus sp. MER TA 171 TaxID=2939577 RepID=UPI00203D1443|nr:hypothetical protein [Psychrobacillus sp. MER TA 171]MCM3359811.1 hypothetical protein [Psychrobacillus sp. MER TA 171]
MKECTIQQYGRPQGPTPEQLFEKCGFWDEVIYSSVVRRLKQRERALINHGFLKIGQKLILEQQELRIINYIIFKYG